MGRVSGLIWVEEELEMAADNLRHLAIEQVGGIGHERLWNWLTILAACLDWQALGHSEAAAHA
jgi:hypothetical protein